MKKKGARDDPQRWQSEMGNPYICPRNPPHTLLPPKPPISLHGGPNRPVGSPNPCREQASVQNGEIERGKGVKEVPKTLFILGSRAGKKAQRERAQRGGGGNCLSLFLPLPLLFLYCIFVFGSNRPPSVIWFLFLLKAPHRNRKGVAGGGRVWLLSWLRDGQRDGSKLFPCFFLLLQDFSLALGATFPVCPPLFSKKKIKGTMNALDRIERRRRRRKRKD